MARIERIGVAPVTPPVAQRLWTDTNRWPTFVDGFGHIVERSDDWPQPGGKVVWESGPAGRGRVTEKIAGNEDGVVTTEVFDSQMVATQTAFFIPAEDGCEFHLVLDYTLSKGGPFAKITDVLFIRRAIAMALDRTLVRFSREAQDEGTL